MIRLPRLLIERQGATAVEYALLATLIGVVIIGGAGAVGLAINAKIQSVGAQVTAAP